MPDKFKIKCGLGHITEYRHKPALRNGKPVCPVCKQDADFVGDIEERVVHPEVAETRRVPKSDNVFGEDDDKEGGHE